MADIQVLIQSILTQSLYENNLDGDDNPLVCLQDYIDYKLPLYSERTSLLSQRLEAAFMKELEEGEAAQSAHVIEEGALMQDLLTDDVLFGKL